jgi:hypothetical protein
MGTSPYVVDWRIADKVMRDSQVVERLRVTKFGWCSTAL